MLFIVPIANMVMENIVKLNQVILVSHTYFLEEEDDLLKDDEVLLSFDMGNLPKALAEAWHYCKQDFFEKNTTIALIELSFSEDNFTLQKVCSLIDKELDYIRLKFCSYSNIYAIPTFPGIFKRGFFCGVVVNMDNYRVRSLCGDVCTNLNQHGIGLEVTLFEREGEGEDADEEENSLFKLLTSSRSDELYLKCRSALRRINETYYFTNKNTIFIYLMSTLEYLASDDYLNFKKTKARILPFLSYSKEQYHLLSEEFRYLSEELRTPVVHCGKSLYEILSSEKAVDKLLYGIVQHITNYCEAVFITGVSNYEDLETERAKLLTQLGV